MTPLRARAGVGVRKARLDERIIELRSFGETEIKDRSKGKIKSPTSARRRQKWDTKTDYKSWEYLVRSAGGRRAGAHGGRTGSGSFGQNTVMDGEEGQLQTVRDADLVIHVAQVILDDLLGGSEEIGNFLILKTLHDKSYDF
jgi:hypothetical protein